MPGSEREQAAVDVMVENRRLGSVMLTAGWILLWGEALLAIYFFTSLRDGSWFWPIWLAVEGVLGLALVLAGNYYRHAVGKTRLGQRTLQRTLAQQHQDEAENNRVA